MRVLLPNQRELAEVEVNLRRLIFPPGDIRVGLVIMAPLPEFVPRPMPFKLGTHCCQTLVYMAMILVVNVALGALAMRLPFPTYWPLPDATHHGCMFGDPAVESK